MYITINDIKGEKRIDLSYSIDSDKEIVVIIVAISFRHSLVMCSSNSTFLLPQLLENLLCF